MSPTPHRSDGTSGGGGGGGGGGEGEPAAADSHGLAMPSYSLPRPPPHRSMSPTSPMPHNLIREWIRRRGETRSLKEEQRLSI